MLVVTVEPRLEAAVLLLVATTQQQSQYNQSRHFQAERSSGFSSCHQGGDLWKVARQ